MSNGKPVPAVEARPAGPSPLRVPIVCTWLLILVTFSMPGRDFPHNTTGMDWIALAKLCVRGFVILALLRELGRAGDGSRRRAVAWCLAPFAAFIAWSFVSIAWSPMLVLSVGQWGSLLAQVLLAAVIALRWTGPRDTSDLVRHLALSLIAVCGLIVAVFSVSPDLSGLNREDFAEEVSNGLVHPTSAGATASLGVVLLAATRLLWGWGWARRLAIPGLLVCGSMLLLSHSRMAAVMAIIVLAVMFARYTPASVLAAMALAVSLIGTAYLAADPGLSAVEDGRRQVAEYFRRGESDEQMSALNGRGDLWEEILKEYQKSPVIGHGYFLTTRTGWCFSWNVPGVRTAHNVLLQILASTGAIGLCLFLWAMFRPLRAAARGLGGGAETGRLRALLLLVGLWYLGWGQLCESFMGPVQPESVVFYCLFGLAVGQVRRVPGTPTSAEGNG